jgi:hypothetical protein
MFARDASHSANGLWIKFGKVNLSMNTALEGQCMMRISIRIAATVSMISATRKAAALSYLYNPLAPPITL